MKGRLPGDEKRCRPARISAICAASMGKLGGQEDSQYNIDRAIADCHSLLTETALVANSTKFPLHTKTFLVSRRFFFLPLSERTQTFRDSS